MEEGGSVDVTVGDGIIKCFAVKPDVRKQDILRQGCFSFKCKIKCCKRPGTNQGAAQIDKVRSFRRYMGEQDAFMAIHLGPLHKG